MDYKKLIKALKCDGYSISQDMDGCSNRRCKYRDTDGACNIVSMCLDASKAITDLLARAEAAEKRAENAERERDAAIFDLERAEEAAEETYILINSKIQPVFDYSVYTAIHDSVSDIVDWEKDEVWRGKKEE